MSGEQPSKTGPGSRRLRVYPIALLATLAAALLFAVVSYEEDDPVSRLGGDYPAFYGAGAIAIAGDWDEIYSAERQSDEQRGLIDDEGSYLYFSYPPFVAGAYAPLGGFEYRLSFLLHTALMAAALAGAVRLLWPWLGRLQWPPVAIYAAALAFYPLLRAVPGGQNTTLSLMLLAAAVRLDHEDRPVAAGVALALLLFKPQFGVVLVPLLVVARRWRVLAGWAGGVVGLYLASVLVSGWGWASEWWDQATAFRDLNVAANGANFVSLPGFVENLSSARITLVAAYVVAVVFGAGVAYYWWRHPRDRPLERYALAGAAVVVAAPQTLFYDAGLLVIGMVVAVGARRTYVLGIAAMIAISWLQTLSATLGWSPLGPVAWAAAAWLLWRLVSDQADQPTPV